jgi:hypothetical protein
LTSFAAEDSLATPLSHLLPHAIFFDFTLQGPVPVSSHYVTASRCQQPVAKGFVKLRR